MKKILLILFAFVLAACGAPPTQQAQPTPIIMTVIVPATSEAEVAAPTVVVPPTEVPPTLAPTLVPPTAEVIVVTATSAPVSAPVAGGAPIQIDNILGKGVFTNMTMSEDTLTLRCTPREITFNITASLPEITDALLAYRVVDNPAGLYPSEWQSNIKMQSDKNGNFSIVFGGDDVDEDLRLDKAWLDIQFIGLNKGGAPVDRTQKIERLITYYKDCP